MATLQNYVTQAENNGGGWVPIVMHNICDSCGSSLSISPATLDAFLTWLQARSAQGTYVRTVHEVMVGAYPPPPPPPTGINLLNNPSLELDANADNQADCWQRAGYGTNTSTWTRFSGVSTHTPGFAESVQITSRTSGDRKLVQKQDAGSCAPLITPGASYILSGWYRSTIPTGIVVYYRNTAGAWVYWTSSSSFALSSVWKQASYTTPPVPAGATALSFGFYLNNVGTLATDDYSMIRKP